MITVKKYTNRRLYDTEHSKYVNLEDVEDLVRAGHEVEVVDEKSGKDVTQAILTQIILEGAKRRDRALPAELLRQMIIASGRTQHELLSRYLTFVLGMYDRAQNDLRQWVSDARDESGNPAEAMLKSLFPSRNRGAKTDAEQLEAPEPVDELAALRERIEQLEARLATSAEDDEDARRGA